MKWKAGESLCRALRYKSLYSLLKCGLIDIMSHRSCPGTHCLFPLFSGDRETLKKSTSELGDRQLTWKKIIKWNPILNNLLFSVNADYDKQDICQSLAIQPHKDIISYKSKKIITLSSSFSYVTLLYRPLSVSGKGATWTKAEQEPGILKPKRPQEA